MGYDEHGFWSLRPTVAVRENRQSYRGDTMVLETALVCDGGVVLIDFMPMNGRCDVVRIIEGLDGEVPFEMLLDVRFGCGEHAPFIELTEDSMCFLSGPDALVLRGPMAVSLSDHRVSGYFRVKKGDRIPIQLTWYASHDKPPAGIDIEHALSSAEQFWTDWVARCAYQGRWRDAVVRSLVTLKAMTFAPTGGVVAAPTTSLPEALGGVRNWDYRFCWIRDASLTLDAFRTGRNSGSVGRKAGRSCLTSAHCAKGSTRKSASVASTPSLERLRNPMGAGILMPVC